MNKLDLIARKLGLHEGGPVRPAPAPARQPPKLAGVLRALNAMPAPAPRPATPTPAPARQPPSLASVAIQRDSNGKIAAVTIAAANGSRHTLAARRDELGRMRSIVIDGRTMWRVQRGGYGEITGLVPIPDTPD